MERYIVMRILLALFVIFTIVFFVVRLASGGDEQPTEPVSSSQESEPLVLSEQNNSTSSVRFTQVGKINAAEDHREIRFTITQDERRVELIQGYDGNIIKTVTLPNTAAAYEEFLFSIESEGFTRAKSEPTVTDSRGQCSHGRRYHYEARARGQVYSDLWSTNCGSKIGTFAGSRPRIEKLFERQFPEYRDFERGVQL